MPFINAAGIDVAYHLTGPSSGPACVLIHGWTGSVAEWSSVIGLINAMGWRTLAIDCPGHGDSPASTARTVYTMHALADLHHDVARALGCVPAVVMGFSMGGAIADEYALRHPDAVRGLVVLGSAGGDWVDESADLEIAEAMPVAFDKGMEALWEVRARRLYPEALERMSADERGHRRREFARTSAEGYVYTLCGLREKRNTRDELARLRLPTLILHGADEEPSIIEAARRLHAAMTTSRYVVVPDAEHFAQEDNPTALNRALTDFLSGL